VPPFRPSLSPQSDVYPKGPRHLPSLPTTHDRIAFSLSTTHYPLFFALCFHTVTNPFSRNPFRFTSIQNPGGRGSSALYLATRHSPLPLSFHQLPAAVSQCLCGKPHVLSILRTLCHSQKSQLLCNQANPDSFSETPGVGGYLFAPIRTAQVYGPAVSLATRRYPLLPWTP
jgi:hypothetical protein